MKLIILPRAQRTEQGPTGEGGSTRRIPPRGRSTYSPVEEGHPVRRPEGPRRGRRGQRASQRNSTLQAVLRILVTSLRLQEKQRDGSWVVEGRRITGVSEHQIYILKFYSRIRLNGDWNFGRPVTGTRKGTDTCAQQRGRADAEKILEFRNDTELPRIWPFLCCGR